SRHAVGIVREALRQDFDGHVAAELGVGGAVDFAHAAFAQLGGDAVVRDGLRAHLPPGGMRRRSSSNQLTSTVTRTLPLGLSVGSGFANTTRRLPSEATSKLAPACEASKNCLSAHG